MQIVQSGFEKKDLQQAARCCPMEGANMSTIDRQRIAAVRLLEAMVRLSRPQMGGTNATADL